MGIYFSRRRKNDYMYYPEYQLPCTSTCTPEEHTKNFPKIYLYDELEKKYLEDCGINKC